jgi:pSer/pThr/pTyr-binding forkhead associated (FHA) protein
VPRTVVMAPARRQAGPAGAVAALLVPAAGGAPLALDAARLRQGLVVGRQGDSDLVIANDTVSKRHARLRLDESGRLTVEDLGSANGTFIGAQRVQSGVLGAGTTLKLGSALYRLDMPGSAAGAARRWVLHGAGDGGQPIELVVEASADGAAGAATWTVGRLRSGPGDLVLAAASVSAQHARLRATADGRLEVCDLGSSNGTFVDGRRIGTAWVALDGAGEVQFGSVRLRLAAR